MELIYIYVECVVHPLALRTTCWEFEIVVEVKVGSNIPKNTLLVILLKCTSATILNMVYGIYPSVCCTDVFVILHNSWGNRWVDLYIAEI